MPIPILKEFTPEGKILMGNLARGVDLLAALGDICTAHDIDSAIIHGLGAFESCTLWYYDHDTYEYMPMTIAHGVEITNLIGNVSIRDGERFVHAHVTLSDEKGHAHGGHLAPGSVVFACEFTIQPLTGSPLIREFDPATKLYQWQK